MANAISRWQCLTISGGPADDFATILSANGFRACVLGIGGARAMTYDLLAINLFQMAVDARSKGDEKLASQYAKGALRQDRRLPGAWFNLSVDFQKAGRLEAAVACLNIVRDEVPQERFTLGNLGWITESMADYPAAERFLRAAIVAAPDAPLPWLNLCVCLTHAHRAQESIAAGRRGVQIDPATPNQHLALSFALSTAGKYAEGLEEFEWRFKERVPEFDSYPMPRWDGRRVDTLFIPCEQGFGDTLQFGRFVHLAAKRAKKVIVCIQEQLFPLVGTLGPNIQVLPTPSPIPKAEAFCPMMSLPVALGLVDHAIPRVASPWFYPIQNEGYEVPSFSGKRKIGIVWAGNEEQDNDRHRSARVEEFLGLYQASNIQLYSIQVGDRARDARPFAPLIEDLSGRIRDFSDTAGIVAQMDAIVSVCTAPAHLAGVLGVPVHILLPYHGQHFVWGHRGETTPWYPSARLYRQTAPGDWKSVIDAVAGAL